MTFFRKCILLFTVSIMALSLPFFVVQAELINLEPRFFIFFSVVVSLWEFYRYRGKMYLSISIKIYIYTLFIFCFGFLYTSYNGDGFALIKTQFYSLLLILSLSIILRNEYIMSVGNKLFFYFSIFATLFNIYEVFQPTSFMKVIGRSSGTYINPNSACIAILCFTIFGIEYLQKYSNKLLYLLFSFIGILLTFSRAGIAIYLIIVIVILIKNRRAFLTSSLIILLFIVILPYFMTILNQGLAKVQSSSNRMDLFSGFVTGDQSINQNIEEDGRTQVANDAYRMMLLKPFLGYGLGAYRNIKFEDQVLETHNMYLAFGVDFGFFGLLIYPYFLYILFLRYRRNYTSLTMFFVFVLWGFASHNILHEHFLILSFIYFDIKYNSKNSENLFFNS